MSRWRCLFFEKFIKFFSKGVSIMKEGYVEVFARYVVRNGKTIYPKNGKYFHFWVKKDK